MNSKDEIFKCLSQAIQQRTTTEIIQTMGTKVLTFQNFYSLIRKYNKYILEKNVEEFYNTILEENGSKWGITQEILQKVIENLPKPKQREDITLILIDSIQAKKVSFERIFDFFDYDNDRVLQYNEFKEMLEYLHPKITQEDIAILMKNNFQVLFSFDKVKTLLSFEQNYNAEVVLLNDDDQAPDEDDDLYDENGQFKGNQEEFFEEYDFEESSPFYSQFHNFKNLYFNLKDKKTQFTDQDFPPNDKSLGDTGKQYEWKRLSQIWKSPQIYQKDSYSTKSGINSLISPRDIKQGELGDCYFLSSLASIAKKSPDTIINLFLTPTTNPYCVYGVWLCIFGQWKLISLDDYVPVYKNEPAFSDSNSQEMWVILLEKAWAKVFGSYGNIISGDPREVIASITGGPTWCISTDDEKFTSKLKPIMNSKHIICAGTYNENEDYEKFGLIPNHAYSVLSFRTLKLTDKEDVHLIKLKNPYGNGVEWNGDWSDHSSLWTKELKDNVLKRQEDDGIFYMSIADFRKYFESVFVGFCNSFYHDLQLVVNCKKNKSSYILINLKKDQEIYFSAYQQSKRLYKILNQKNYKSYDYSPIRMILAKMNKNNQISLITSAEEADMSFHIGGRLQKGQYILQIKANWQMEDWDSHDISLVSYGEEKPEMKFCQKIPNFHQTLLLQDAKEKKEKSKPLIASHENLKVIKDIFKPSRTSYHYYQNFTQDKVYKFNLVMEGEINWKKPNKDKPCIQVELKPGQDRLICYKLMRKGQIQSSVQQFECKNLEA